MPQLEEELFSAVIVVSIILILLAFVVVFVMMNYKHKQQMHLREKNQMRREFEEQLLQAQIEVQESTYRHIAKELHDNVGQLLSTTKMLMGVTELKLGGTPDTLATASATLTRAIEEIRLLSRSLDREWLEQFNFLANLQNEMDYINSSQTVRAAIACHTTIDMKPNEQIILFRMVQEAMQNALRHAQPSWLQVLISKADQLQVQVINDGKPLPPNFSGMGTNNMRQRAKLFGGSVNWVHAAQQTVVTISIPLKQTHEN